MYTFKLIVLPRNQSKVIHVVAPPYGDDKSDPPDEYEEELRCDQDIYDLEKREMGRLCFYDSSRNKYIRMKSLKDLVDNQVYVIKSHSTFNNGLEMQRRHVDSKVLEQEATLAVKNCLGQNAHEHYNVITKKANGKNENEYDGVVVHNGGENIADSEVYVIECAYSPTPEKVKKLLAKLETAKLALPSQLHFATSTNFFPVLGGRFFTDEIENLCKAKNIWQVKPSGGGYCVRRNFTTGARRFLKAVFK